VRFRQLTGVLTWIPLETEKMEGVRVDPEEGMAMAHRGDVFGQSPGKHTTSRSFPSVTC
jgi:hypothetical protein